MKRRSDKDIERWLTAEARGETAAADKAFAAVITALPRLEPRAGFAERATYGLWPEPSPRLGWLGWWSKAATVAALALVALTAGLMPLPGQLGLAPPSTGSIVEAIAGGATWLAHWFATGLGIWSVMIRVGNAIGVAMTTPQLGAALLATALVGAAALYELNRLLVLERRTT